MKRRPKSDLKLVFKDDTGVEHESKKFKKGVLVLWNFDMSVHLSCNPFSLPVTDRFRPGMLGPTAVLLYLSSDSELLSKPESLISRWISSHMSL